MATLKTDGLETVAIRMISSTRAAFTYGALSSNATAESTAGTTLTGEIATAGLQRAAMTCTNPSTYVFQMAYVWTSTQTVEIMKVAFFNDSTAGNMLGEHLFSVAKGLISGETLTITAQGSIQAA
jgi:hypothetical protein